MLLTPRKAQSRRKAVFGDLAFFIALSVTRESHVIPGPAEERGGTRQDTVEHVSGRAPFGDVLDRDHSDDQWFATASKVAKRTVYPELRRVRRFIHSNLRSLS